MDRRIRRRKEERVETCVRGRTQVARERERSGSGDQTVDVAARTGGSTCSAIRRSSSLTGPGVCSGSGPLANATCDSPSGSSASQAPRNALDWPEPRATR